MRLRVCAQRSVEQSDRARIWCSVVLPPADQDGVQEGQCSVGVIPGTDYLFGLVQDHRGEFRFKVT
ncbi:hypothetical protein CF165_48325 [Amycolatopsis vastitatis]|uniref:Uncharacterized protein n=1 Tax=Amycolatopsis vastitatis TaxID=1905142 RepID=A0A229SK44_9PSEU|nr:hypothetical protein CF165_48325 [Amycolatopsis vastitatis]